MNYLGHWEEVDLGGRGTGLSFTFRSKIMMNLMVMLKVIITIIIIVIIIASKMGGRAEAFWFIGCRNKLHHHPHHHHHHCKQHHDHHCKHHHDHHYNHHHQCKHQHHFSDGERSRSLLVQWSSEQVLSLSLPFTLLAFLLGNY